MTSGVPDTGSHGLARRRLKDTGVTVTWRKNRAELGIHLPDALAPLLARMTKPHD